MTYQTDTDQIRQAAEFAAERLLGTPEMHAANFAFVVLEPLDATRYPVTVIGDVPVFTMSTWSRPKNEYLVTLHASFGRSYPWAGLPVHADYAASKWAQDSHHHTGLVMAGFLEALSVALREQAAVNAEWLAGVL